jgi:23S rRNA pseudouridine1911/1915/1917 synthase
MPGSAEAIRLIVPSDTNASRLDQWLARTLPDHSRSEIQRWIQAGRVTVNGDTAKRSYTVAAGDTVEVVVPIPQTMPPPTSAPTFPLNIVYEDDDLLVIDKQPGVVVHPAPGHPNDTLVDAILYHRPELAIVGEQQRPGIVHRLDMDTSGLIVVAKTPRSLRNLQTQFKQRQVRKTYLALVEGIVAAETGTIDVPMGRHPTERKRQAAFPPGTAPENFVARPAVTTYERAAVYTARIAGPVATASFTLVRAYPHTGRTHQIRVHFAYIKHPVVGDPIYGYPRQRLNVPRLFLHAHKLRFRLPSSGMEQEFVSPLPPDLQRIIDLLESESQS